MSTAIQRSFAGGEIAPQLYGRADQAKYATGLRTCRNFTVQRFGGVANRAGLRFVCEVKTSTKKTELIPFAFNDAQTYVLEFGDQYMRVIKAGAQVTTAAAAWNGGTAYVVGDLVLSGGITYYCILANTGNIPPNASFWYALTGVIFEMPTPYLEADLYGLRFVQSADVVTIVHPNYAPRELRRTADTGWTLVQATYTPSQGPVATLTAGAAGAKTFRYTVSRISASTGRESVGGGMTANYLATITGATKANPCVITAAAHGLITGDIIEIVSVVGMTQLNDKVYTVTKIGANTFSLDGVDSTNFSNYTSGGAFKGLHSTLINAADPTSAAPIVITWTPSTADATYNVYRIVDGVAGFIGSATGGRFEDDNIQPDTSQQPPLYARPVANYNPFGTTNNFPSVVWYFQQRLGFANTLAEPERIQMSRTGDFHNFDSRTPTQDDDPLSFTMVGRQVNEVRGAVEVAGKLVMLTRGAEWTIEGDTDGVVKPTAINARQQSYDGSSTLAPVAVGQFSLYVQARGSYVRDLVFDFQTDGYRGRDLSIFATHLFDGFTIADWDYAQIPDSIVWACRSDGVALGLTYLRDQEIFGWHRHDTDGTFERVCVIANGDEDQPYFVVKRTINGVTKRYIERLESRRVDDITVDAFFVDAGLTYDGRNATATTMTLSGGPPWTVGTPLTLTASASFFIAGHVGRTIVLHVGTVEVRCLITGFTSGTVVTAEPQKDVPAAFQSVALAVWSLAAQTVTGLGHLEAKTVSVLADGNVEAQQVVVGGSITLSRPFEVIHVGLPYVCEFETLDLDNPAGVTLVDKRKRVNRVTLLVQSSRGIFAGQTLADPLNQLREFKPTLAPTQYGVAPALITGPIEIMLSATWNDNGRVAVRQVDPLPIAILAAAPSGEVG